jgi:hypothetical protein
LSPAPKRELAELRDRLLREVDRVIGATDGLGPERLADDLSERMSNWSVQGMIVHAVAHAAEHAGQAELTRDLVPV